MRNFIKRVFLCLMIIPCAVMVVACKNNNNSNSDGNNNTPANPPTSGPAVTLSSFSTEVVDSELESKFNESTNTFTIEYGDAMPSIEDFAITATYSDGTTQSVTGIKVVCPVEHYQNAMVVRDALYEMGYRFESADVAYIPQTTTVIDDPDTIVKMQKLLAALEDNDDVNNVWHSWEMPEEDDED